LLGFWQFALSAEASVVSTSVFFTISCRSQTSQFFQHTMKKNGDSAFTTKEKAAATNIDDSSHVRQRRCPQWHHKVSPDMLGSCHCYFHTSNEE